MPVEIERKFLVNDMSFADEAIKSYKITQGFLSRDPERTVRVRLLDNEGKLTIKGIGTDDGLERYEWETQLTRIDALDLMDLCETGVIEKIRYQIPNGDFLFEVDVFKGENKGLIIAEIELPNKEAFFNKPQWLGEEVTGDIRYYNSYLSTKPFDSWT